MSKQARGEATRQKLMDSCEEMVGQRGPHGVDGRSIGRHAEQGNNSAVQHHFGTLDALIEATLDRAMSSVVADPTGRTSAHLFVAALLTDVEWQAMVLNHSAAASTQVDWAATVVCSAYGLTIPVTA